MKYAQHTGFLRNSFCLLILLVLFSCNGAKNNKASELASDKLMTSEKISKEAFELSWVLMNQGQKLADEGSEMNQIIKTFPAETRFQTNENSILFFIEGSSPMLIELSNTESSRTIGDGDPLIKQQQIKIPYLAVNLLGANLITENEEVDVVASQKGEDVRQDKKALLISPYIIDFGGDDDNYIVDEILSKNKNYKGAIDYKKHNLSLSDYENFGDYDIVNISSHGKNFCGNIENIVEEEIETADNEGKDDCRTLLATGVLHGFDSGQEAHDFISTSVYQGLVVLSVKHYFLRSTFFEHFYSSGLKNRLWYFSACEMGQLSDMTSAMQNIHENGHFYYWTNTVHADDARNASKLFYTNLVKYGMDAKKAYAEIPRPSKKDLPSVIKVIRDGVTIIKKATTSLIHQPTGKPRHGIEVIEMLHPEEKRTIKEGDLYPIVGDFGDGTDEALTLDVKIIGYTRVEFEEKGMRLSLKVDDKMVLNKQTFLPDIENDEIEVRSIVDNEYGVEVIIKDIAIPDLEDKKEITLRAYLYFDNQRFSIHNEKVKIKAEGILAELKNANDTSYFFYDDENKTMRMESNDSPNDTYFDDKGYLYFYNQDPNEFMPAGWIKNNAMSSMLTGNFSFKPIAGEEHINDNSESFQFPVIAWAINYRVKYFEQNPNFKKQKIECDEPRKCTKFVGMSGEETGHYATFNSAGKLIEMGKGNFSIKYTYGYYGVQLPNAQEVTLPFSFN